MLYLNHPTKPSSPETQRALHAADGYLYFQLFDEALEEIQAIPAEEQEESAVLLARIRLLLHMKQWISAEKLSSHGATLHPEEGEFMVQKAFALHQLEKEADAIAALGSAPAWIRETGILHYNLACYEARLGDLRTARECIDAAIQINSAFRKNARTDPDLQALWN